jgi:hypothetical protein
MLDFSDKEKRAAGVAKWAVAVVGLAILAPVVFTALQGMLALAVFVGLGVAIVNFAPLFGRLVGIWRVKGLKKLAEANPIETLEIYLSQRRQRLVDDYGSREDYAASLEVQRGQIVAYEKEFPDGSQELWDQYNEDVKLLQAAESDATEENQNIVEAETKLRQLKMKYNISQGRAQMAKTMKGRTLVSEDDRTSVKAAIESIETASARSSATLKRLVVQREQRVGMSSSINELRLKPVQQVKELA